MGFLSFLLELNPFQIAVLISEAVFAGITLVCALLWWKFIR